MAADLRQEDQILSALRRITRAIDLRSRTLFQSYGLTAPQLAVLQAVRRLQPATSSAIAKQVHLGHSTVTGIMDRLERRELIERVRGEHDRRSVLISLRDRGRTILENAPSLLQDRFQRRLAELSEWESTQLLATLQRIADMMDTTEVDGELAAAAVAVRGSPQPPGGRAAGAGRGGRRHRSEAS